MLAGAGQVGQRQAQRHRSRRKDTRSNIKSDRYREGVAGLAQQDSDRAGGEKRARRGGTDNNVRHVVAVEVANHNAGAGPAC